MAGNIFVADWKSGNIKEHDPTGKFIKAIGQPVQGPGYLIWPLSICMLNDTIYDSDTRQRRISIFKTDGEFIKTFRISDDYIVGIGLVVDEKNLYIGATNADKHFLYEPLQIYTRNTVYQNIS